MTKDELEAANRKIFAARVVPLLSGNFAVYFPPNEQGMQLAEICTIEDLPDAISRVYFAEQQLHERYKKQDMLKAAKPTISLEDLL